VLAANLAMVAAAFDGLIEVNAGASLRPEPEMAVTSVLDGPHALVGVAR